MLCGGVVALVALVQALTDRDVDGGLARRLEWMTYDWRARQALNHPGPTAPNLGFVFITDDTIEEVLSGRLGYSAGLYWPRHIYGRLVEELDRQGAQAVAFDLLLAEMRPDHAPAERPDGTQESSDYYLVRALQESRNVILAAQNGVLPPDPFRTNACAIGDIGVKRDQDGILRRARAYADYVVWHPMIAQAARRFQGFRYDTNALLFPVGDRELVSIPIDPQGYFDQGRLYELSSQRMGSPLQFPAKIKRLSRAYTRQRVWNLGLTLAARHLELDLTNAVVEPGRRVVLRGPNGHER